MKKYINPEINIDLFELENIMTASGVTPEQPQIQFGGTYSAAQVNTAIHNMGGARTMTVDFMS